MLILSNQDNIFPQFCYLEASSSVNQQYFEMSYIKNGFQRPLKPIIFKLLEHHLREHSELASETPLGFYFFQLQ